MGGDARSGPGMTGDGMPDRVGHDEGLAISMLQNGAVVRNGRGPSGGVAGRGLVSGGDPRAERVGRIAPEGRTAPKAPGPEDGGGCPVEPGMTQEGMPDRCRA